jgi:hypothetical protein
MDNETSKSTGFRTIRDATRNDDAVVQLTVPVYDMTE